AGPAPCPGRFCMLGMGATAPSNTMPFFSRIFEAHAAGPTDSIIHAARKQPIHGATTATCRLCSVMLTTYVRTAAGPGSTPFCRIARSNLLLLIVVDWQGVSN